MALTFDRYVDYADRPTISVDGYSYTVRFSGELTMAEFRDLTLISRRPHTIGRDMAYLRIVLVEPLPTGKPWQFWRARAWTKEQVIVVYGEVSDLSRKYASVAQPVRKEASEDFDLGEWLVNAAAVGGGLPPQWLDVPLYLVGGIMDSASTLMGDHEEEVVVVDTPEKFAAAFGVPPPRQPA